MSLKILTNEETAFFCEQLAMILEAGIPVADGLEVFAEDSGDKRFREISNILTEHMSSDDSALFTAMEKSRIFPDYAVKMVKIGSVTGRLEDTLSGLSDYYSKRAELRQTVKSAVSHPLLLLAMMTAVVVVMVIKVMVILLAALAVTLVIAVLMQVPAARRKLYGAFTNFVLTGKMSEAVAMADVTGAMSMMTACGIAPEQTLELAAELTENKAVKRRIKDCETMVLDGEYFADAIGKSKLLPSIYARSLKVAYKSGAFDAAWKKIDERLSLECDRKIYSAVSFIEPVIIGILAIIIGAVLIAVMLPMTDIITSIG